MRLLWVRCVPESHFLEVLVPQGQRIEGCAYPVICLVNSVNERDLNLLNSYM